MWGAVGTILSDPVPPPVLFIRAVVESLGSSVLPTDCCRANTRPVVRSETLSSSLSGSAACILCLSIFPPRPTLLLLLLRFALLVSR